MTAPKTYLQLAQALRQEVGASGAGPASVLNQTGEYKRIVDWIAAADEEIQQEHDNWRFMFGTFTLDTVAGDGSYLPTDCTPPLTSFRTWRERTIKCYLLSAGVGAERHLTYVDYDQFDALYNTGMQNASQPVHYTVGDQMQLLLGPKPDGVYRVRGEYCRSVSTLTADSDVPPYPAEFHRLAVYLAMMKYGRFTASQEVFEDGQRLYRQMLRRMERTQLPRLNSFLPMA